MKYNENFLKRVREQYPPGTRIRLTEMKDPYAPVPPGTEGEVNFVDDAAHDSVNHKVKSLFFTVEQVGSQLMGIAECRVQGDMNDAELERLKEYASGQASDGFGEGFEQRPIKIGDNELYVSLWSSNQSWSIMTQDELEQGQQMGGMQLS